MSLNATGQAFKYLLIATVQAWCETTLLFLNSAIGSELTSIRSSDVTFGPIIAKNVAVASSPHPMRDGAEEEDNVPHWILSAMRCLAHWPEKAKNNAFPSYKGDLSTGGSQLKQQGGQQP